MAVFPVISIKYSLMFYRMVFNFTNEYMRLDTHNKILMLVQLEDDCF